MRWLFKSEPTDYSFADLERDGSTEWTGVKNPLAARHLASVKKGDAVLFYHTGNEKAIVGIAKALGRNRIAPVRRLERPVALAAIRRDPAFRTFDLVRNSRLSVMPVSDDHWKRIGKMSPS